MEEENLKNQWHPGFVAAVDLELAKDRGLLWYEREYNLNTKPLSVDLLVIRKNRQEKLENEIGQLFREYNLMEYKSPEDKLDHNTLYKVNAYASLYKIYDGGQRKPEEITVSILRQRKPAGLFRYVKERGGKIENPYQGIYYIYGREVLFATQVIVTGEMEKEKHVWLTSLSNQMKKQDMERLLQSIKGLKEDFDRELADSVLEVSIKANPAVLKEWREGDDMCQALLEVMKPEIDKIREEEKRIGIEIGEKRGIELGERRGEKRGIELGEKRGEKRGIELGEKRGIELGEKRGEKRGIELGEKRGEKRGRILGLIEAFRELGRDNKEIANILVQKYGITEEEVLSYL